MSAAPGNYLSGCVFEDVVDNIVIGDTVEGKPVEGVVIIDHVGELNIGKNPGETNSITDVVFEKPVGSVIIGGSTDSPKQTNICSGVVFKGKVGTFRMGNVHSVKKRERLLKEKEKNLKKPDIK